MGNQQGANNPYQAYQPQGSQIGGQTFPYGNVPNTWAQGMTPSVINNYYQQGYPPAKWPSVTNIPIQQSQLSQQNLQGSYVNQANNIKGSQINQVRGSQLNANPNLSALNNYGAGIQLPQYGQTTNSNPSYLNNQGPNLNMFSNLQRTSNVSQQQIPQTNTSQLQYNPSQLQQLQSQLLQQQQMNSQLPNKLPSNLPRPSIIKSNQNSGVPQSQIQQNASTIPYPSQIPAPSQISPQLQSGLVSQQRPTVSEIYRPPSIMTAPHSILQNKNEPMKSAILRNNRSSSKQKKITFGDEVPRSVQLLRANVKLAKDKFDKMAGDNQMQLFGIMEQIDSQVNQGIPSKDRLYYLLNLKKNYEQVIIRIRMKQQKLAKVLSQINNVNPSPEISELLQNSNKDLSLLHESLMPSWRQILNAENNHPDFMRFVQQGKMDASVTQQFQQYNTKVQAAFSNLPPGTSTSSVMTIMNTTQNPPSNYNYGGYTGVPMTPSSSLNYQPQESVLADQSQTAKFGDPEMFPYASNLHPSSTMKSNVANSFNINITTPSQLHTTQIYPQSPPSIIPNSKISDNEASIASFKPISPRPEIPRLADFVQSKVLPPPPQMHAFVPPPLPTPNAFRS